MQTRQKMREWFQLPQWIRSMNHDFRGTVPPFLTCLFKYTHSCLVHVDPSPYFIGHYHSWSFFHYKILQTSKNHFLPEDIRTDSETSCARCNTLPDGALWIEPVLTVRSSSSNGLQQGTGPPWEELLAGEMLWPGKLRLIQMLKLHTYSLVHF